MADVFCPSLKSTAGNLLLNHLAEAHFQLREQEKITSRAVADTEVLQAKVKSLDLELANRSRSLVLTKGARDMEVKENPSLLNETLMRLEEANAIIDKLLQERSTRLVTPNLPRFRSEPVPRSALRSHRPYVCLIIDGDANHFLPALYQAGGRGGEAAAERLKQAICGYIAERRDIPQYCLIKVQIFLNRSGFVETVSQHDRTPRHLINACLDRFFQSQPTWDLVDTGPLRESADTKIKGTVDLRRRSACY